ncbi:hypothetical protein PROPEN_01095 [Proteus penneri ATCC 35198]|nr:hypothetical protein PROPEN_01095 [Proteus penneri ATCC 35198]
MLHLKFVFSLQTRNRGSGLGADKLFIKGLANTVSIGVFVLFKT